MKTPTPKSDALINALYAETQHVGEHNCPERWVILCREIEEDNAKLRDALVELRRWVGDGDCSDDAGCVGFQTTAYRDVIAQADSAILANTTMSGPMPPK